MFCFVVPKCCLWIETHVWLLERHIFFWRPTLPETNSKSTWKWMVGIRSLMEEILHQLIGSLSHYFTWFHTSQVVVWDFFHQPYVSFREGKPLTWPVKVSFNPPPELGGRNITPPGTLEGFYDTISTHGRVLVEMVETCDVPDMDIYIYTLGFHHH